MKLKIYLLLSVLCFQVTCLASTDNEEKTTNRISWEGAISGDAWRTEFSYHYMLSPYYGFGGSIGRIQGLEDFTGGDGWLVDEDSQRPSHLYLSPSIHLDLPSIVKIGKIGIGLYAEPGLMLTIPYERINYEDHSMPYPKHEDKHMSSHGGNWAFFNVKAGLNIHVHKNLCFTVGYNFSTFDINTTRRTMKYNNKSIEPLLPKKENLHEITVSLVGYF